MENRIPNILPNKDKTYYGEMFDLSFQLLEEFYAPFKTKGLNFANEEELTLLDKLLRFQAEAHGYYRKDTA